MEATELRIGNCVVLGAEMKHAGQYIQIDGTDLETFDITSDTDGIYEPILLTSELKEKLGLEGSVLTLDAGFGILAGEDWSAIRHEEIDEFLIIPCKYVHQLQNLFFALTGNELPVSL
jgi:hypothetical protein